MPDTILVTGGLGYIGSHTCVALAEAGYSLAIVDNLSNAKRSVLDRLSELCPGSRIEFHPVDLRDRAGLEMVFARAPIAAVAHFAGLKAVAESVAKPLLYYANNVGGTLALLDAMKRHRVQRIVFSSSATVYGEPQSLPYTEDHPLRPMNPYGWAKLMIERILADEAASNAGFVHASLRYFNPIGAHPSGRIGEDPNGVPNNLLPYLTQVAIGRRPCLRVFGDDYDTVDGTGVRDYIHVMDLAAGHVAALQYLERQGRSITVNLGTGRGHSVLEVVQAFERAAGVRVPLERVGRRAGDIAAYWADVSLAARELGWRARFGLEDMCRDAWRWQSIYPGGCPD